MVTIDGRRRPLNERVTLAEPVDASAEAERLVFRRVFQQAFAVRVTEAVSAGVLPPQELLCKIRGMFIEKIEVGWGAEVAKEIEAARERAKLPALPPLVIEGGFSEDKDLSEN